MGGRSTKGPWGQEHCGSRTDSYSASIKSHSSRSRPGAYRVVSRMIVQRCLCRMVDRLADITLEAAAEPTGKRGGLENDAMKAGRRRAP